MDGITVYVLGDYGPFSRIEKSVGYRLRMSALLRKGGGNEVSQMQF
jgi:hypothetical protein